jgi:photosystem II stability/assembly factor-like uncharacterized protein
MMSKLVAGVFLAASFALAGYGQSAKVPFTLSWQNGKCIQCTIPVRLADIQVVTRNDIWAVGFDQPLRGSFVVVHSTDAGRTWREVPRVKIYAGPDTPPAFSFLDRARGWIAWYDLNGSDTPEILRTSDAGEHWQNISRQDLQKVFFFDDKRGYGTRAEKFFRTTDGGVTWAETTIPRVGFIDKMIFLTPEIGWIAGADGKDVHVLRTTDGGSHWEEARITPLKGSSGVRDLFFVDQDHGWLITWNAASVYVTVDGGKSWSRAADASFQGEGKTASVVRFVSKEKGFLFVDEGKRRSLMYTTDGGAHWSRQSLPQRVHDCQVFEGDLVCSADGLRLLTVHPK